VSGNKPPDPSNPGGSKKSGVALQIKLPCATLDDVRTRHPELSTRRFFLRTANPRPVETPIRLTATLSDGKHCFRANAIVEKVNAAGEGQRDPGITLWLARMDDPGRELVAWMGGQPPPLLKQPAAAEVTPPAPPPPPAKKPASTSKTVPPRENSARPAPKPPAPPPTPHAAPSAKSAKTIVEDDLEVMLDDAEAAPPPAAPVASAPPQRATPAPPPTSPIAGVNTSPGALPPRSNWPGESRRPAPAPLPRPTLTPGAAPTPPPQAAEEVDELPRARPAKPTGPIVGIDLGTTNSCAAVVKDGKPFVIPSREGYNTIPSVVALSDKGKLMVGHPARSQLLINPRNTVYGAKRLIGRQFNSPVVTDLLGRFSYEIVSGPRGEAAVKIGEHVFSLQKISSLVLAEVKDVAERWLGTPISRAVITVPAYYNDNQRQAVRAAGALAGLDVERIVNEPTAAAIAFAQGRALEQRVMVYDLGGGTFDTSILELHGNVYEVISTGGDTFLGGVDFDKALVQDLLARGRPDRAPAHH